MRLRRQFGLEEIVSHLDQHKVVVVLVNINILALHITSSSSSILAASDYPVSIASLISASKHTFRQTRMESDSLFLLLIAS